MRALLVSLGWGDGDPFVLVAGFIGLEGGGGRDGGVV